MFTACRSCLSHPEAGSIGGGAFLCTDPAGPWVSLLGTVAYRQTEETAGRQGFGPRNVRSVEKNRRGRCQVKVCLSFCWSD